MVNALVVLLTLCGQPLYIIGHDINGSGIIGTPEWIFSQETPAEILDSIASMEDAQIVKVKLEDINGGICA